MHNNQPPGRTPPTIENKRGSTPPAPRVPSKRSAVTNGTRLFIDGQEDSPWARRFRDLLALHLADLGPPETLSEAQFSLCRRVATMETELEQMEAGMASGHKVSLDIYQRTSNSLARILKLLGIKREARTVSWRDRMKGGA